MAKPAAKAPVSAHPLFPVIVALWFAALLGVGTMVLPQTLFDALGSAAGLGTTGLGFRFGIGLVAGLGGAAIGLLMARMAVAGQGTAKPRAAATRGLAEKTDRAAKRPISALEELGSDGLDEPIATAMNRPGSEPMAGRRRALAVTDESAPSEYLTQAPLPGGGDVLDLMGVHDLADDQVLELGHFEDGTEPAASPFIPVQEPFAASLAFPSDPAITDASSAAADSAYEPFGGAPFARPADEVPMPEKPAPTAPLAAGPFAAPDLPRPFSPPPAARAPFAAPAADPAPAPEPEVAPPFGRPFATTEPVADPVAAPAPASAMAPFGMPQPAAAPATFSAPFSAPVAAPLSALPQPLPGTPALDQTPDSPVAPVAARPSPESGGLAGLGMVDLVDRFAESLRRASKLSAQNANEAAAPAFTIPEAAIGAVEPALPPFAPPVVTAPVEEPAAPLSFGKLAGTASLPASLPTSLPAALQPFGFGETDEDIDGDDGDGDAFSHAFSLPLGSLPRPFATPDAPAPAAPAAPFAMPQPVEDTAPEPEESVVEDDHFGSLLAMKSGFGPGREFVRIEDEDAPAAGIEPVVVFPGTAQPGRAAPAPDGPSREPAAAAPFRRPPFAPPLSPAQHSGHAFAQPADRQATEAALRDALAKLQHMSGAA